MRRHIPQRMMEQAMARRNARVSLKPDKSRAALTITHPNAAGIDIGSASHFVAVPPDRDDQTRSTVKPRDSSNSNRGIQ